MGRKRGLLLVDYHLIVIKCLSCLKLGTTNAIMGQTERGAWAGTTGIHESDSANNYLANNLDKSGSCALFVRANFTQVSQTNIDGEPKGFIHS